MTHAPAPTPPAAASPLRGIVLIIASSAFLTTNDALMKWLASELPVGQIVFLRGFFVMAPLLLIAWRGEGLAALRGRSVKHQAMSAALFTVSLFIFVSSLPLMALADAIVLIYTSPIFVMALAPVLLGERVGWRRWSAAALGFAGVALVTRPGTTTLDWVFVMPLTVALLLGLRDILMRRIVATESSLSIVFIGNVVTMLAGLATISLGWVALDAAAVGLLALSGIFFALAQYLMVEAFRHGEAVLLAPFRYTSVIWAVVLGYFVWNQHPDAWGFLGILLISGSALFIARREARVAARGGMR